ncbi:MAG: CoA transferase [Dehalococcoidales bacterium]|nr:CoA transferase [Dehalococcoidales bacterium]
MDESRIETGSGPLNDIKVVDLTRALAGPVCSMILGDMGAEVIRIDQPSASGRILPPDQPNPYNRNKKSITLNMRADKAGDIFNRLIRWGDVLVENYRPGVMKQMGFDYDTVHTINPGMVMTSISGYGQTGPYANRAAFDSVGQAVGGLMGVTTNPDGTPTDAGAAVCDISAGIFGALGTVLALYSRKSTGLGQHVDSSLVESVVFLMGYNLSLFLNGQIAENEGLFGPRRTPGAGCFQAKDGGYIIIMAQTDQHWPVLAGIIGREDLVTTPGYRTRREREKNGEEIKDIIAAWVCTKNLEEVEAIIEKAGIPFGRVQNTKDLLSDPHLKARERFIDLDFHGKVFPVIAPYPILSGTPGSIRIDWQKTGEHNEEIYHDILGYSHDELETFKNEGVI